MHGNVRSRRVLHHRRRVRGRRLQADQPQARMQHGGGLSLLFATLPGRRRLSSAGCVHVEWSLRGTPVLHVSAVPELRGRELDRALCGQDLPVRRRLHAGLLRAGQLSGVARRLRGHVRLTALIAVSMMMGCGTSAAPAQNGCPVGALYCVACAGDGFCSQKGCAQTSPVPARWMPRATRRGRSAGQARPNASAAAGDRTARRAPAPRRPARSTLAARGRRPAMARCAGTVPPRRPGADRRARYLATASYSARDSRASWPSGIPSPAPAGS